MKVILLGTAYPYRGGLASFNERLALALQEQGHEVEIVTFTLQYPNFIFPGKTQYSDSPPPAGLNISRRVNAINPFNWLKVGSYLRKQRADLLLIKFWLPLMGPCFGSIARLVRKNRKTRVITILDNVIPHEKRAGDRLFTRYFLRSGDAFVAMSNTVLQDLRKFDTTKPRRLNPHPVFDNFGSVVSKPEAKRLLELEEQTNYLLFFGFIRDYKGLDILLQAMADERVKETGARLIVAGEFYKNREAYEQQIKALHLEEQLVLRTEFIADEEVYKYFCAADLVVQPYKHATQSGVTQIAYHFNKPMLVTRVGGLAELVPDGRAGYVVDPDPASIATSIADFYTHHREAGFLPLIREEKKRFTWEAMVKTLEALYAEIT